MIWMKRWNRKQKLLKPQRQAQARMASAPKIDMAAAGFGGGGLGGQIEIGCCVKKGIHNL